MTAPLGRGTRQWLRAAGHRPRPGWGQNFLINPRTVERLLQIWALPAGTPLLEIGAGAGALTLPLLASGVRVWAVERDADLCALLEQRWQAECPQGALSITCADIRRVTPDHLAPGERLGIQVGNLPYALTASILAWTARRASEIDWAAYMVQREVGERLLAPPGSRTYGALTVGLTYRFRVERQIIVRAADFWPRPRVDSMVVRFAPHPAPPVAVGREADFRRVVRAAFGHRRKMLAGALRHGLQISRAAAEALVDEAGIDGRRRPETCDLEAFAALSRALGRRGEATGEGAGTRLRESGRTC